MSINICLYIYALLHWVHCCLQALLPVVGLIPIIIMKPFFSWCYSLCFKAYLIYFVCYKYYYSNFFLFNFHLHEAFPFPSLYFQFMCVYWSEVCITSLRCPSLVWAFQIFVKIHSASWGRLFVKRSCWRRRGWVSELGGVGSQNHQGRANGII